MKTSIKILFWAVLLFLFSIGKAKSQNVVVIDRDTLITVTPSQARLITFIITDLEATKKKEELTGKALIQVEAKAMNLEKIIKEQVDMIALHSDSRAKLEANFRAYRASRTRDMFILAGGSVALGAGLMYLILHK